MPAASTTMRKNSGRTTTTRTQATTRPGTIITPQAVSAKKISIQDPYLVPYPSNDKLLGHVGMSGNVEEDDGFKLEVQAWKTQVWSKVPQELESAYDLLGDACRLTNNAETCPHTMIFQAAINERLQQMDIKRDEKGELWVLEYELPHPFETLTDFFDKNGKKMDHFYIQANDYGYYYCQFWLKAVPKRKEGATRTIGKRVGKAASKNQQP
jgi:hypothetical protein